MKQNEEKRQNNEVVDNETLVVQGNENCKKGNFFTNILKKFLDFMKEDDMNHCEDDYDSGDDENENDASNEEPKHKRVGIRFKVVKLVILGMVIMIARDIGESQGYQKGYEQGYFAAYKNIENQKEPEKYEEGFETGFYGGAAVTSAYYALLIEECVTEEVLQEVEGQLDKIFEEPNEENILEFLENMDMILQIDDSAVLNL